MTRYYPARARSADISSVSGAIGGLGESTLGPERRKRPVELSQCPYDHTAIAAEVCSGGSIVLTCPACGAAWEWHGAWMRRLREPDREKMRAARANVKPSESAT